MGWTAPAHQVLALHARPREINRKPIERHRRDELAKRLATISGRYDWRVGTDPRPLKEIWIERRQS